MSDKKNFLDDINRPKPESFQEEVFIKHKRNLLPSIIVASSVLVAVLVLILVFTRGAAIPDMSGWTGNDVKEWSDSKNILVVIKDVYSSDYEAGVFISAQPEAGTKVGRNDTVTVTVSKGADPNEEIAFPDLKNMTLGQVNAWIDENKLTGVTIRKENSSVFAVDAVINYEMVDGSESTFIRKHRVRVYVSLGPSILDETVSVPSFSDSDKASVLKWANDYEISVEFLEQFSEYVEYGRVASQSIEAYTKMNRTDVLVITMSLGKALKVPDFTGMSRTEAAEAADSLGIQLQYRNEVSKKPEGTVLGQDYEPGTEIHSKQMVTLTLASESEFITIPNLIGLSSSEASGLAGIHGLNIFMMQKESTEPSGTVIGLSAAPGSEINKDDILYVYISKGNILVPDFSAMSRQAADLWAMDNGISVTYVEVYSDTYSSGALFGQNHPKGMLLDTERLVVYQSMGRIAVRDFSGSTKLDVLEWQQEVNSKGANIALKFHTVDIPGMDINRVVDQSYKNELIGLSSRLDVWISTDGGVMAPDFTGLHDEDFMEWCEDNGITYRIEKIYSNEYSKGILFGQNLSGIVIPEGTAFIISESIGRPTIPLFRGFREIEVRGWVNNANLSGADLKLTIIYEYSPTVAVDTVIRQNIADKTVDTGTEIKVYMSLGVAE
jgi:serine/threonine-protein kinase